MFPTPCPQHAVDATAFSSSLSVPITAHYIHSLLAVLTGPVNHCSLLCSSTHTPEPSCISHSAADPQCPSLPCPAFCAPSYHLYIVFHPASESLLQSLFPVSRFHFVYLAVNAIPFSFIFPLYPQQALLRSAINFS